MSNTAVIAGNFLPWLFLLAATGVAAQVESQTLDVQGEVPLSAPEKGTSRINFLTMGLRISSDLDSNVVDTNQNQQRNLVASIQPHLGWQIARARLDWAVDYTPGLSRSQSLPAYNSSSQQLESSFQLRLTKRLRLRMQEGFLKSTNPFDGLRVSEPASPGTPNIPPDAAPATPAEVRTEQASAEVAYALSAHDTAGIGGEFFSTKYNLLAAIQLPNQVIQNSRSASAHAYYSRQFTRHQWTGFDSRMQQLAFNNGESRSRVYSLFYTHRVSFSRPLTLSLFLGPERSITENVTSTLLPLSPLVLGQRSTWQWSEGATGRWVGMRTSISASSARMVSDDRILGAAQLSKASGELSRQFARQWTTRLLASYEDSKALAIPVALRSASAAAGLTHALGRNVLLEAQYWRVHLSSSSSLPATFPTEYSRTSMSLVYDFKYALGR